jgi:hypothetical protein
MAPNEHATLDNAAVALTDARSCTLMHSLAKTCLYAETYFRWRLKIDDAVARFGELHALPNWVVARCIQTVRG